MPEGVGKQTVLTSAQIKPYTFQFGMGTGKTKLYRWQSAIEIPANIIFAKLFDGTELHLRMNCVLTENIAVCLLCDTLFLFSFVLSDSQLHCPLFWKYSVLLTW